MVQGGNVAEQSEVSGDVPRTESGIHRGEASRSLASGESSEDANLVSESQRRSASGTLIKRPIFISTAEPDVLALITSILFVEELTVDPDSGKTYPVLDSQEYQLVCLTAELFKKLNEQYLFGLLSEAEQKRQRQLNLNEQAYHEAATQAVNLDEYIRKLPARLKILVDNGMFTHGQLKHIYHHYKKPMTDELTWTLIDFLTNKGFLSPVDAFVDRPREKVRYRLTLNDQQRLAAVQKQYKNAQRALSSWMHEVTKLETEMRELEIKAKKERDAQLEARDQYDRATPANRNTTDGDSPKE